MGSVRTAVARLLVGALVISAVAVLGRPTPAAAEIDPPPPLADWTRPAPNMPWYPSPLGMAFDADGDLWMLESWYEGGYNHYAVERDPATGTILRKWSYDVPGQSVGGWLELDPAGNLWIFGGIGRFWTFSPAGVLLGSGTLASVDTSTPGLANGSEPTAYAIGPDGDIWTAGGTNMFANGGSQPYEALFFRHDPAGEVIDSWPRPQFVDQIEFGPDGDLYVPGGRYDEGSGAISSFVTRYRPTGEVVSETQIGGRDSAPAGAISARSSKASTPRRPPD